MPVIYTGIILILISAAASHQDNNNEYPTTSQPCHVGDVAENDCNNCTCTSKHIFECDSKPCNKNGTTSTKNKLSCHPNMLYVRNKTVCICKADGSWPHDKCKTTFKSFHIKPQDSCEPNAYVIIDCNVCKCGADGKLNKKHCTKYECRTTDIKKARRNIKQNQVYGTCEANNWYSLAPCQFCFCISENKLVCNTGNNYSKKIQLGSYNLSICGTDLLKDAISLVPDEEKAMRFEKKLYKSTTESLDLTEKTNTKSNLASIEFNRENNRKQQFIQTYLSKSEKNSDEYDSEYEEPKVLTRNNKETEGLSTKFPYDEDENNSSEESDSKISDPGYAQIPKSTEAVPPSVSSIDNFPQHFEWTGSAPGNEEQLNEAFNLGDVLKPYLPVVMDKVFQMALRKSMVSIDAHANCTPGATTVFKCNACFCMKNAKLLCTTKKCE